MWAGICTVRFIQLYLPAGCYCPHFNSTCKNSPSSFRKFNPPVPREAKRLKSVLFFWNTRWDFGSTTNIQKGSNVTELVLLYRTYRLDFDNHSHNHLQLCTTCCVADSALISGSSFVVIDFTTLPRVGKCRLLSAQLTLCIVHNKPTESCFLGSVGGVWCFKLLKGTFLFFKQLSLLYIMAEWSASKSTF